MNYTEICQEIDSNLSVIDQSNSISEKISKIEESHTKINEAEKILENYKNSLDTYQSQVDNCEINLDQSMTMINELVCNCEEETLDQSMANYEKVMDEIKKIELFMEEKKKDFQLID